MKGALNGGGSFTNIGEEKKEEASRFRAISTAREVTRLGAALLGGELAWWHFLRFIPSCETIVCRRLV